VEEIATERIGGRKKEKEKKRSSGRRKIRYVKAVEM
jgi:hypothetical protein